MRCVTDKQRGESENSTGVGSAPDRLAGSKCARNTGHPVENKHVLLSHDLGRVCGRDCGLYA